GDLGGCAGGVDRERVVELSRRDAQDRDDDLDLVAQAVDERRAQRAVDETADQDGLRRWTTLTAEEAAGDLAGGIGTLLDVHREREEVEVVLGLLAGARGAQKHRVLVEVGSDGTLCLLRETTGLETDR